MRKKWYRTNAAKAILIVAAHIAAVVATVAVMWFLSYPALRTEIFGRKKAAEEYGDTAAFSGQMEYYSMHALQKIKAKDIFETEGKYDPDKLIDIEDYCKKIIKRDTSNAGGLVYRLGDLLDWYEKTDGDVYNAEVSMTGIDIEAEETGEQAVGMEITEEQESGTETAEEQETDLGTAQSSSAEVTGEDTRGEIVVCKKADGSYYYYRISEFEKLVKRGTLIFVAADAVEDMEDMDADDILSALEDGYEIDGLYGIRNREGKVLYSDCWLYNGERYPELYPPRNAGSILELANEREKWNGNLDKAYSELAAVISSIGVWYEEYTGERSLLKEGDTNFSCLYADTENKSIIYANRKEYESYEKLDQSIEKMKASGKYVMVLPELADFETNMDIGHPNWRDLVKYGGPAEDNFLFVAAVDTAYPIVDDFYLENELYQKYGAGARAIAVCGLLSVLGFLACAVVLSMAAGRSTVDDEIHLNGFDRWKTELAAAVVFGVWFLLSALSIAVIENIGIGSINSYTVSESVSYYTVNSNYVENAVPYIIIGAALAAFTCGMFLIGFLSLVRRIKARTLWKNSILKMICQFVGMVFAHLNSVWKLCLVLAGFLVIQLLLFATSGAAFFTFLLILADGAAFVWLVYQAVGMEKIKKGIRNIAGGEVDYKIPMDFLRGSQKEIAEEINSIGEGLDAALAKSMKSERLKTDLITNVSHDIKTPLTSIINYVELLKQENFEDPKIQRYIEVLETKSQRLKTLTEDVVEASKISSGNISLEYMNLNLVELVQQVSGEFEEKFQTRGLKEILSFSEDEVLIRADGRRMWRILENIYNNAAKYAMEGTRVYVDLKAEEKEVSLSLKNISEQPLNISADELTERFIRGDVSRSTEGSGLGLSIAKTLAEMQGGSFQLYLDGDLFKVTVTFPRVRLF